MSLFYVPDINLGQVLSEEESQHAVRVLRLQAGNKIEIVFSKPNVTVKKLQEQVYHPMHIDEHCMYFAPFIFNISRSVAETQYMCEYDY